MAVAASVPDSRWSGGISRVSPTKSLLEADSRTGQPVAVISASRRVTSSECQVFLPKSCAGSRAIRAGARLLGADVRADQAGAELGGHLGQPGVGAAPAVIDQVRARGARLAGDL